MDCPKKNGAVEMKHIKIMGTNLTLKLTEFDWELRCT